ncbi:MAG TPA: MOSC domain-containing protein [Caldimonas sp.]|nr:MOSC domain-containing protein [Caldimonas sp.]
MPHRILSVNVSRAQPLVVRDGSTVSSGILKRAVSGPVRVDTLGLEGDEQADLRVHGGPGRAVYAYPHEHYTFWETVRAQTGAAAWGDALPYGAMGENLTLSGLLESDVWIGDLLRAPDCVLAVSQPRYPCFKFDAVMGFAQAAKAMVTQGWCGFYLAVRVPGTIEAGQPLELVPGPREIGVLELFRARTRRA